MTALPSFVQLMATLGLDNKSSSPPTQEFSSPAIVVSSEHEPTQEHISSRVRVARYSPYGPPISHSHRRTASTLSNDGTDSQVPNLNGSTSPRHRPSALKLGPESRHRHISDSESSANMPISTFVRRKTPTSSPVSPTFAHRTRRRSQSPTFNPVSLPTLPPVFVSHVPRRSDESLIRSSSPSESDNEDNLVHPRTERLTPDYSFSEDRHSSISTFSRNNLLQDATSRCVSPLA